MRSGRRRPPPHQAHAEPTGPAPGQPGTTRTRPGGNREGATSFCGSTDRWRVVSTIGALAGTWVQRASTRTLSSAALRKGESPGRHGPMANAELNPRDWRDIQVLRAE